MRDGVWNAFKIELALGLFVLAFAFFISLVIFLSLSMADSATEPPNRTTPKGVFSNDDGVPGDAMDRLNQFFSWTWCLVLSIALRDLIALALRIDYRLWVADASAKPYTAPASSLLTPTFPSPYGKTALGAFFVSAIVTHFCLRPVVYLLGLLTIRLSGAVSDSSKDSAAVIGMGLNDERVLFVYMLVMTSIPAITASMLVLAVLRKEFDRVWAYEDEEQNSSSATIEQGVPPPPASDSEFITYPIMQPPWTVYAAIFRMLYGEFSSRQIRV